VPTTEQLPKTELGPVLTLVTLSSEVARDHVQAVAVLSWAMLLSVSPASTGRVAVGNDGVLPLTVGQVLDQEYRVGAWADVPIGNRGRIANGIVLPRLRNGLGPIAQINMGGWFRTTYDADQQRQVIARAADVVNLLAGMAPAAMWPVD